MTEPKPNHLQHRLVRVDWVDSHYANGWKDTDDIKPETPHLEVFSVGWLIKETDDVVLLSAHFAPLQIHSPVWIPKVAITRMRDVAVVVGEGTTTVKAGERIQVQVDGTAAPLLVACIDCGGRHPVGNRCEKVYPVPVGDRVDLGGSWVDPFPIPHPRTPAPELIWCLSCSARHPVGQHSAQAPPDHTSGLTLHDVDYDIRVQAPTLKYDLREAAYWCSTCNTGEVDARQNPAGAAAGRLPQVREVRPPMRLSRGQDHVPRHRPALSRQDRRPKRSPRSLAFLSYTQGPVENLCITFPVSRPQSTATPTKHTP